MRNYEKALHRKKADGPKKRRCPLQDTLQKLLGSSSKGRQVDLAPPWECRVWTPWAALIIHFLSTSPFAIPSFSPEAEVRAANPEHQQSVQTNQAFASSGGDPLPNPASSSDSDFICQKKKKKIMQIRAKLKICSSLLLVPRVPRRGIFKWLSSSEAKEERGDRWSHAFLQRVL